MPTTTQPNPPPPMKHLPIPNIELEFKRSPYSDFTLWLFQEHPVKLFYAAECLSLDIRVDHRRIPSQYELHDEEFGYFPSTLMPD